MNAKPRKASAWIEASIKDEAETPVGFVLN